MGHLLGYRALARTDNLGTAPVLSMRESQAAARAYNFTVSVVKSSFNHGAFALTS